MSHFSKIELRFVSHVRIGDIIQVSLKAFSTSIIKKFTESDTRK